MPDKNGESKQHHAVGRITYHDGQRGTLLYLKLSYSGDEPEYLRSYKRKVPAFPHESTADQFFDETKFEVYRALGHHVTRQALEDSEVRDSFTLCGIHELDAVHEVKVSGDADNLQAKGTSETC